MKAISKTAPILFLACILAISVVRVVPVFAADGPAIYLANSIYAGRPVTVSGVGFTPSATITFKIGDQVIQTVVADSSGAFIILLPTGTAGAGIWTITATDGKSTAQAQLTISDHADSGVGGAPTPGPCAGRNSIDTGCGASNPPT